jgi:hypothetical protein
MYKDYESAGMQSRLHFSKFILASLFILTVMVASMPEIKAQTTLNPVADTDSQNDNASGTGTTLYASQWNHLFLRYDMSALSGSVTNATLRIYQSGPSTTHTLNVNTTSTDTWSEGGTKPTTGTLITTSPGRTAAGWIEINLTSHVQTKMSGNKIVSVSLTSNIGTWTPFSSRQNATNKPELVITTSSPAQIDANHTTVTATINGSLSESFWNINTPITKAINGTPNNSASFGVA